MNSSKKQLAQKAIALSAAESWADACAAWQRVVDIDSRDAQAWSNLGLARARAGHYPEAIDAFGTAMKHGLAADKVALGMGIVFCLRQQYDVARENLEMAVANNPDNIDAWSNLVVVYARLGLPQQTFQAAERVLSVNPNNLSALSSLASLCKDLAIPDEAIAWSLRAAEAAPDDPRIISNLLWAMLHANAVTAQEILAQAREFDRRAMAKVGKVRSGMHKHEPHTKLRIGWVSGDLRNHAVGHFVVPVLEQLNKEKFESVIYYNSNINDEVSQRAKRSAIRWHDVAQMSDAQLATRISKDDIDIVIDLAGHTDGSRLTVFAQRLAPVQVTWLGYPGTSGLSTMDYIFVPPDSVLLEGAWCSETPKALPDCYCVRDKAYIPAEPQYSAPYERNGYITFGCLNNFAKVSPAAIATWADILCELKTSRLVLVVNSATDHDLIAEITSRFNAFGVDADRLTIRGRMSAETYFAAYRDNDIGLDAFPFTGGTTGVDSLSMSTPFITLAGQALHARMGANLLRAVGLDELIASTQEEYVQKAVALAQDRPRLTEMHRSLRRKMEASPLMDVVRFTCGFEKALVDMHTAAATSNQF